MNLCCWPLHYPAMLCDGQGFAPCMVVSWQTYRYGRNSPYCLSVYLFRHHHIFKIPIMLRIFRGSVGSVIKFLMVLPSPCWKASVHHWLIPPYSPLDKRPYLLHLVEVVGVEPTFGKDTYVLATCPTLPFYFRTHFGSEVSTKVRVSCSCWWKWWELNPCPKAFPSPEPTEKKLLLFT